MFYLTSSLGSKEGSSLGSNDGCVSQELLHCKMWKRYQIFVLHLMAKNLFFMLYIPHLRATDLVHLMESYWVARKVHLKEGDLAHMLAFET